MQSAIGRSLLLQLPRQLEERRRNATILNQRFSKLPSLRVTIPPAEIGHAYYKYYVFVRTELLRNGWSRDRIVEAVRAEGIPCFSGSCSEVYLEKAFPQSMRPAQRLPVARQLGETSLLFLVHPTLSTRDMLDTAEAVEKVLGVATIHASATSAAGGNCKRTPQTT
jgi:dTDP-4-amino-4,6-dideoxygalactose transaminase